MKTGRPRKYKTVEEMSKRIDEYFDLMDKLKKPYLVTSMCIHLDLDRVNLLEYEKLDEFHNTIKKAKSKIKCYAEEQLFKHNGQVAGVIFNLKNNWSDDYQDEKKIDLGDDLNVVINIKGAE